MIKRKSYRDELVDYIKKNLKKGYTAESLKWALISQGYSRIEVEKAIIRVNEELSLSAPLIKTKPEISREIFDPTGLRVEPEETTGQKVKGFFKHWFGNN